MAFSEYPNFKSHFLQDCSSVFVYIASLKVPFSCHDTSESNFQNTAFLLVEIQVLIHFYTLICVDNLLISHEKNATSKRISLCCSLSIVRVYISSALGHFSTRENSLWTLKWYALKKGWWIMFSSFYMLHISVLFD